MKLCTVCARAVDREDAAVLVMSPFGNPKLLCDECEKNIITATTDRSYDNIVAAMERLGRTVSDSPGIDEQSYDAVKDILERAGERAVAIRDGSYDFSLDETPSDTDGEDFEEIPEELKETEEDAELDRKDEEFESKFNKIFTWISAVVLLAAAAFVVYRLLDTWVF